MKIKRVLQVTGSTNRGGAETMIMNLYRKLDRTKFQFDFVVFGEKGDFDEEIQDLGGTVHYIRTKYMLKREFLLWKILKNNKEYQIIHCHTNFSNAFHILVASFCGVKMRVSHSHNTSDFSRNIMIRYFYHSISKFIINLFSTHFLACGIEASKFLFYKNKKVLILPNSVDVELLSNIGILNRNYINNLNVNFKDCIKIIQVGRFVTEKNYIHSLQIANELKSRNIRFKFFIVGRGELELDLRETVKEFDLENYVIFMGVRNDVPYLMAGSDVMIMPSFYEGFPVVLVEAQAVGLKCLISNLISSEVELNIGLIKFLDLKEGISKWADELLTITAQKNKNKEDWKTEKIKEQGFDTKENIKYLENFYMN